MAITEADIIHHDNDFGEKPKSVPGQRFIGLKKLTRPAQLGEFLNAPEASEVFEELAGENKGVLVQARHQGLLLHVFENKHTAEISLGALGLVTAGVFMVLKSDAGKWTLARARRQYRRLRK